MEWWKNGKKHDNGTLEFRNYGINGIEEFMDLRGEGLTLCSMRYALCVSDVTFLDGVFDEVGGLSQIQFLHDIGTVVFYGTDADKEKFTNLLTRFSLCNQLQDFSFTSCQALQLKRRLLIPTPCLYPIIC